LAGPALRSIAGRCGLANANRETCLSPLVRCNTHAPTLRPQHLGCSTEGLRACAAQPSPMMEGQQRLVSQRALRREVPTMFSNPDFQTQQATSASTEHIKALALSMGDPAGIGPEVLLKALHRLEAAACSPMPYVFLAIPSGSCKGPTSLALARSCKSLHGFSGKALVQCHARCPKV
ncbi:MAG: hypothetical protein EB017_10770, partial [Betaproteobacteria bacterium]|nr:hypothetical protein [Betaproteobacteria bacterium]